MNLEDNLNFFIENQEALVRKHRGKILVIKERKIVGVYDSLIEAYLKAQEKYTLGTFSIQPCDPGPDAYSVSLFNHSQMASQICPDCPCLLSNGVSTGFPVFSSQPPHQTLINP